MSLPFQRALVTGANGFIGAALALRLLKEGVAVRAVCRKPDNGSFLTDAEVVQGDVQDADRIKQLAAGCDLVFHVAAVGAGSAGTQYSVNVLGTEHVTRAAIAAGASRLVHVSTVGVYGVRISGDVAEADAFDPSPRDFYQQSKALGERAMWRIANEAGLPATVIRPAFVYGPRSQVWTRGLYELCRRLRAIPALPGNAHPIFVEDLVDLLIIAAGHSSAVGHAFNGSADPVPWQSFLSAYARLANVDRILHINADTLAIAGLFAHPADWLLRLSGLPQDVSGSVRFANNRAAYSNHKAHEILGWEPRTALAQGMDASVHWLAAAIR